MIMFSHATRYKLEDFAAELLDYLFYIHDIFNLKIEEMSAQLTEHLLQFLFLPQLVGSLSEEALQVSYINNMNLQSSG